MGMGKSGGGRAAGRQFASSWGRGWAGELRPGGSAMTSKGAAKCASDDLCYWLDERPKRT